MISFSLSHLYSLNGDATQGGSQRKRKWTEQPAARACLSNMNRWFFWVFFLVWNWARQRGRRVTSEVSWPVCFARSSSSWWKHSRGKEATTSTRLRTSAPQPASDQRAASPEPRAPSPFQKPFVAFVFALRHSRYLRLHPPPTGWLWRNMPSEKTFKQRRTFGRLFFFSPHLLSPFPTQLLRSLSFMWCCVFVAVGRFLLWTAQEWITSLMYRARSC